MNQDKLTEFITVLAFALLFGAAAMLSVRYLSGTQLEVALLAIVVGTIISWKYLRKKFNRG
jgi:hypothetical protein